MQVLPYNIYTDNLYFEAETGLSEKKGLVSNVNEQLAILDDLPKELKLHILRVRHWGNSQNMMLGKEYSDWLIIVR